MSAPTVLEVMDTLKGWFASPSWDAWRALLAALFALPMTEAQLATYRQHTERTTPPTAPAAEAWIVAGRRAGKTLVAAFLGTMLACFKDYRGILAPGERGVVMLVAADRRQARVVFRYVAAFFDRIPSLAKLVERRTAEALHLTTGISLEVHTASFRTVRGYTVVAFVGDEIAFWRDETSANPDVEILNAVRPALATVPGALLLAISSPYARRGALWESYKHHFGRDGDPVFVWQADTRSMNPLVDERLIAAAYEQDEASARAEYGAEFRTDVETFVAREAVEAVTVPGRYELPARAGVQHEAVTDPAGGSGKDSWTLGIGHREMRDGRAVTVMDLLREVKPPFSPEQVAERFAQIVKEYGLAKVSGDKYAGEWPREQFRKHGVEYALLDKPKSELYRDLLPAINSGAVELLDSPRLLAQLCALERRTARGGKDSIDHAPSPHAHDDLANVAAALVSVVSSRRGYAVGSVVGVGAILEPHFGGAGEGRWDGIGGLTERQY